MNVYRIEFAAKLDEPDQYVAAPTLMDALFALGSRDAAALAEVRSVEQHCALDHICNANKGGSHG